MTAFMRFVSGLFHPLLLTSYLMGILYIYQPQFYSPVDQTQIPKLISAGFITTFLIPVLSVLIMKLTSRITSLSLSSREERFLPFISILLFYGSTTYLFTTRIGILPPLSTIMFTNAILIALLLILTSQLKISIHAAANWALAGIMASISIKYTGMSTILPLALCVLIAGLVSSSRLFLGRHTPKEVWIGSGVGFTLGLVSVIIFG